MTHDTRDMQPDEWRSTIPPAEACTEIGADDQQQPGEGGLIAALAVAVLSVFSCIGMGYLLSMVSSGS